MSSVSSNVLHMNGGENGGKNGIKKLEIIKSNYDMYNKKAFVMLLEKIQKKLKRYVASKDKHVCEHCNETINNYTYIYENNEWDVYSLHCVKKHDMNPNNEFINFVYDFVTYRGGKHTNKKNIQMNIMSKVYDKNKKVSKINGINELFIKLDKNKILILDALMIHGGYNKKYYDDKDGGDKYTMKYSEHSGIIKINDEGVIDKIIVSAIFDRIEDNDDDIYLPADFSTKKAKYIFHSHPPTPFPGGRIEYGILLEFPSIGDILHFVQNFNENKLLGSLVLASEGLYNIRKKNMDKSKIVINEDDLYKKYNKLFHEIQKHYIKIIQKKYGKTNFISTLNDYKKYLDFFYSEISHDSYFLDKINTLLEKYDLHVDFFPRKKDKYNNWFVDTVFLPII